MTLKVTGRYFNNEESLFLFYKRRENLKGGLIMYGLIAIFDEKTEQLIKEIWKQLSEKSISFYA